MSKTLLPDRLAAAVKRETAGELVRWTGQPNAASAFVWTTPVWIFAIPWTAFSLFWESLVLLPLLYAKSPAPSSGWGMTGGWVGVLFGVPFVVVGFAMMSAPFYVWWRARAMAYVMTDKRLLAVEAHRRHATIKTIWPDRIVSIERTERADGSGSLKLLLGQRRDSDGDLIGETETIAAVPDVRKLEQLLAAFRPQPALTVRT